MGILCQKNYLKNFKGFLANLKYFVLFYFWKYFKTYHFYFLKKFMRYLQSTFIILFFFLSVFFSFWISETYADRYITQVNPDSSPEKVKKLQEVFKWLGLYDWEIDWDFFSVREALVNYQLENWIIPSKDHYEAGYFWNKTIKSLKEKYWKDFEDLQKEYLKMETPKVNQEGYFIVTAYYSPLPGQSKYSTWSYESEIKLNGWWNTASWKKPSVWTIAAPRNYLFWTKIELEWFWVWVVEDRWWAIVNSWDRWHLHDRLDIWMWYWDEARERTRAWWVRTVKWTIVDESTPVNVSLFEENSTKNISNSYDSSSLYKYKNLYISPENPVFEDVKLLQELLKEFNLYSGDINWNYESIKDILIDFQINNWIISSRNSEEAWYFWKKTYSRFLELNRNAVTTEKKEQVNLESKKLSEKQENDILSSSDKKNIKKIRDKFYEKLVDKFSWNKELIDLEIEKTKKVLLDYSYKLNNEKKISILKYFVEVL